MNGIVTNEKLCELEDRLLICPIVLVLI